MGALADVGFDAPNLVSTIGYAVMFAGVIVFLVDAAVGATPADLDAAVRTIAGSARSMGVTVEGL